MGFLSVKSFGNLLKDLPSVNLGYIRAANGERLAANQYQLRKGSAVFEVRRTAFVHQLIDVFQAKKVINRAVEKIDVEKDVKIMTLVLVQIRSPGHSAEVFATSVKVPSNVISYFFGAFNAKSGSLKRSGVR
jgi:hypothetical protein